MNTYLLRDVPVGPYQMTVPGDTYLSRCFLGNGLNFEPHVVRKMQAVLNPGSILLDVGANWGYYTLVAATRGARTISVEPNPFNVEMICRNIRRNEIPGSLVLSVGAGDGFGMLNYQGGLDNPLGKTKADQPGDPVAVVPLDTLLPGIWPDLVKIDIEGQEPAAIWGMTRLLSRNPVLVTEFCPEALAECGSRASSYIEQLGALPGYTKVEILNTGQQFPIFDMNGWDAVLSLPICDLALSK